MSARDDMIVYSYGISEGRSRCVLADSILVSSSDVPPTFDRKIPVKKRHIQHTCVIVTGNNIGSLTSLVLYILEALSITGYGSSHRILDTEPPRLGKGNGIIVLFSSAISCRAEV